MHILNDDGQSFKLINLDVITSSIFFPLCNRNKCCENFITRKPFASANLNVVRKYKKKSFFNKIITCILRIIIESFFQYTQSSNGSYKRKASGAGITGNVAVVYIMAKVHENKTVMNKFLINIDKKVYVDVYIKIHDTIIILCILNVT